MLSMFTRKSASIYNQHIILKLSALNLCFNSLTTVTNEDDGTALSSLSDPPSEYNSSSSLHLSPFFSNSNHPSSGFDIEVVDCDAWGVSSVVAQAWRQGDLAASGASSSCGQHVIDEPLDDHSSDVDDELDFEDIDNMRVRGNLFYKLERSSMEFEEYNLEFHKKKSSKKRNDKTEVNNKAKANAKAKTTPNVTAKDQKLPKVDEFGRSGKSVMPRMDEINDVSLVNKRQRNPTFNQLTGPYHEPFCLDIYISKASVRACIVHRVTSKVVVVAHSISKDLKFDLSSTKNKTTCAAVGEILAQRALADDIHDIIYTPRKGERVEGKLQIVLNSIIDSGINVKLKIKQRHKKKSFSSHFN
ncbi:50S ribosomal protein L18 [Trifolium repens]|nr:50S ribosomal protein L18 [Trifolium repens]